MQEFDLEKGIKIFQFSYQFNGVRYKGEEKLIFLNEFPTIRQYLSTEIYNTLYYAIFCSVYCNAHVIDIIKDILTNDEHYDTQEILFCIRISSMLDKSTITSRVRIYLRNMHHYEAKIRELRSSM